MLTARAQAVVTLSPRAVLVLLVGMTRFDRLAPRSVKVGIRRNLLVARCTADVKLADAVQLGVVARR